MSSVPLKHDEHEYHDNAKWNAEIMSGQAHLCWYAVGSNSNSRIKNDDVFLVCPDLEDNGKSWLFGVFDGHGPNAARLAVTCAQNIGPLIRCQPGFQNGRQIKQAIIDAFHVLDKSLRDVPEAFDSGCCGTIVLMKNNRLYVANIGHCKAVLNCRGRGHLMCTEHIAEDPEERKRIECAGASVATVGSKTKLYFSHIKRNPSFSRSFGDMEFKMQEGLEDGERSQPIVATPHVEMIKMSIDNNYVVVATQPFWSYWNKENLMQTISRRFKEGYDCSTIVKSCLFECCRRYQFPEYKELSPVIGVSEEVTMMIIRFDAEKQKEIQFNWVGKKEFNPDAAELAIKTATAQKTGNCVVM
eukprot:TRINITY_DN1434_c0_g1_i1.p1 TRINITY_DN1434_c0_g1~~TRINITY_DN1434_c0_g1_i1.p1  ORF type:complete len:356 (+),score=67.64 TRINITY_DN1434_c0_g1_i1:145-1212(+)